MTLVLFDCNGGLNLQFFFLFFFRNGHPDVRTTNLVVQSSALCCVASYKTFDCGGDYFCFKVPRVQILMFRPRLIVRQSIESIVCGRINKNNYSYSCI